MCVVDDGKRLEEDVNSRGPGEALFVKCDVTETQQIEVRTRSDGSDWQFKKMLMFYHSMA